MRRVPPPLRVTRPPPSSTTSGRVLRTLAVWRIRIVTCPGPHAKLILPPARTAETTAAEVQLRAVPWPMTRVGTLAPAAGASAAATTIALTHPRPAPRPVLIGGHSRPRQ